MLASDVELLRCIAAGDRVAFADFYDRHAPRVLGLLVRMLRRRAEAEDVLQECFLQVWSRAASFSPERAGPLVWLMLIARSRAVDHLRRRRRESVVAAPECEPGIECVDTAERAETTQRARAALAQLPEEQRGMIRLAFYDGLTHEEIAESQRIPLGTVKTRIRRGMMRLRELLAPPGPQTQKAVAI